MLIRVPRSGVAIFAKLYKRPVWTDRLKYFILPSKASAEWSSMRKLLQRGLPVARPIARGEKRERGFLREAYLFTEALEGAAPLCEFASGSHSFLHRARLCEDTARLVAEMHREGFFCRDLHAGNLLVVPADGASSRIYLVDLHKVWHTGWVPLWMRMRDLAQLRNSLTVSRTIQLRFLGSYLRHANLPAESLGNCAERIAHKAARMWNAHLKSRTKRCLKESSEFAIDSSDSHTMYRRRLYPEDLIETLLKRHQQASQDDRVILKKTSKETVSVVSATGSGMEYRVVIKESHFTTFLSRLRNTIVRSRARRNWIGAQALHVRGIATPDAMALVEYRSGVLLRRTLLLTGYVVGSHELNEYVLMRYNPAASAEAVRHKRRFIAALAGLISDMHEKDIYHADLKSNNILVREEGDGWNLYLVDLDRIRCGPPLSFRERANNLAQINASVASCITTADRVFFFRQYAHGTPLIKSAKRYFRQIMAISRKKNTIPYGLIFKQP